MLNSCCIGKCPESSFLWWFFLWPIWTHNAQLESWEFGDDAHSEVASISQFSLKQRADRMGGTRNGAGRVARGSDLGARETMGGAWIGAGGPDLSWRLADWMQTGWHVEVRKCVRHATVPRIETR